MSENNYNVKGKLIVIGDTQTFPSGFSKREFVLETADKYPQSIKLEVVKDKCPVFDTIPIGSILEADFNLRGNEHKGRYYVNLQAWKFEVVERGNGSAAPDTKQTPAGGPVSDDSDFDEEQDSIPF